MSRLERRLAVAAHERRQALFAAREAHGDRPTEPPAARGALPSVDDLIDSGPTGKRARWKLVLAVASALVSLAGLVGTIGGFFGK